MSKRNIYFYSLKISHTILIKGVPLKQELDKDEVYAYLKNLHATLPSNDDGLRYLKHSIVNNEYFLIEFMNFDKNSTFVRLGKPSQNNEVGKRNTDSFNLVDIPLENAELIEAYTYLYIDFKTGVISFLRVGSAPSIRWFAVPLTAYNADSGFTVNCDPFLTEEILDSFGSNAEVGSISITTVRPTAEITQFMGGVTEDDMNELDSSEMNVVISIKPTRKGGNTINSKKFLAKFFDKTKDNEEDLKKFTVNIADEMDEKKSVIDLMSYRFVRTSDILSTSKLTTEQYKDEIVKVYERELISLKKLFKI